MEIGIKIMRVLGVEAGMEFRNWYRKSASEEGDIYSCIYEVENPKAVIQIVHGMCEHSGRYDDFAQILAQNGYVVCANDHLGHGESHLGHYGTFAKKAGGFDFVIEDIHTLFETVKEQYPEVPCILLGHSMGSILAALYAETYEDLDGLILMGTPAPNKLTGLAKKILSRNVKKHGYTHKSKLCNFLMWGPESLTMEQKRRSKSWLSYNESNIESFIQDEKCDFSFSDSANLELVQGLERWSSAKWGEKISDIPILVIAGAEDPIGKNGRGPRGYYKKLKKHHKKVKLKLVKRNKHEILNEYDRDDTYQYIMQWIEKSFK